MDYKQPQNLEPIKLNDEAIAGLIELGELLRSILNDALVEGYTIENGKLIPPQRP